MERNIIVDSITNFNASDSDQKAAPYGSWQKRRLLGGSFRSRGPEDNSRSPMPFLLAGFITCMRGCYFLGYHDIPLLAIMNFEKQLTSKGLPIDGARGSMARPGTKNTGNHLAKMAAPGLNTSKAASPNPGRMSSATTMSANNMQHPPSWEGKGISYLAKSLRRTMSMIMKYAAPVICLEESEAAAPPRVAVAAAAVDSVDTTGVSRPKTATPDLTLAGAAALERGTARVGAPTADADRASTAARHRAEAQRKAKENLMVGM